MSSTTNDTEKLTIAEKLALINQQVEAKTRDQELADLMAIPAADGCPTDPQDFLNCESCQ